MTNVTQQQKIKLYLSSAVCLFTFLVSGFFANAYALDNTKSVSAKPEYSRPSAALQEVTLQFKVEAPISICWLLYGPKKGLL